MWLQDSHALFAVRRGLIAGLLGLILLLAACGRATPTPAPATFTPIPAPATPATAATVPPPATEIPAVTDTPVAAPQQPADAPAAPRALAAFVRERALYLQADDGTLRLVEDCAPTDCFIQYLRWSPDGAHLLYYVSTYDHAQPPRLNLAALDGTVRAVATDAAYVQPAAWSPDGAAIVYRLDTGRYAEAGDGPAQRIQTLWTVPVAADGSLGEPQLRGEVTYGEGCGGGGRSESGLAYEREGGNAYGYLGGLMAWTPGDILLYSDNCANRGVSRFDLATNTQLEGYAGGLRSLSLTAAGDVWAAIDEQNRVVMGTPGSLETTLVALELTPEMVYVGRMSGEIYVTTLTYTGDTDVMDLVAGLDESIRFQPFFVTTEPHLYAVSPETGEARHLHGGEGYAYARVNELADGTVLFAQVEDTSRLLAGLQAGELTAQNWRSYLPTVDVMAWSEAGVMVILPNAEQYTPAP